MMIFASLQLPKNVSLVNHVWQEGLVSSDGRLRSHAMTGANVQSFETLDFQSGSIVSQNVGWKLMSRIKLRIVHAIVNVISWGTLMPIGVIMARHLKRFEGPTRSTWFQLHRVCQSIALLFGTVGFATGLYMGKQPGIHNTPHRCVGITLMTLTLVQVCVAILLRPKNDHKYRIWWNIFHFLVGYTTIVLAIWNVFKGFDILGGNIMLKIIYACVVGCLVLIGLSLEVVAWIMWFWNNKSKELGV